jgi:hypothetical protein
MSWHNFHGIVNTSLRFCEANKFCGNSAALMHQLVEAVLAVGARLTKDNWAGMDTSSESLAFKSHTLTIAFHIKLLNMSREA